MPTQTAIVAAARSTHIDVFAAGARSRPQLAVVGPYLSAPNIRLNRFPHDHGLSHTRSQVAGIAALLLAARGNGRQR